MTSRPAHFTIHAFRRVRQRLTLRPVEVARLIGNDICVPLGSKPGILKTHVLFYSVPDSRFFIAIQDSLTGSFITVLPERFHAKLAWEVSDSDKQLAKQKAMLAAREVAEKLRSESVSVPPEQNRAAIVSVTYLSELEKPRTKKLCRLDALSPECELETEFFKRCSRAEIISLCCNLGIDYGMVVYFGLRINRMDQPYIIYRESVDARA